MFADELATKDSHLTAEVHVNRVENFYSGSALDQKQLFGSDQKRNPQIVRGRFAVVHFTKNFFRDRQQHIVSARFVTDRRDLPDPFRARHRNGPSRIARRRRTLGSGVRMNSLHGGDKSIAAPRQRLNVTRVLVRIAERAPQRLDGGVYAMLEIHERVGWPQAALQFFSRKQLAGLFEQQRENLKGPAGETDFPSVFAYFARAKVNVVGVEAKPTFGREFVAHLRSWGDEVYFGRVRNSSSRTPIRVNTLLSVYYGFTFVSPTNDLRCIERFRV